VSKYTEPLGKCVADIYGFELKESIRKYEQ